MPPQPYVAPTPGVGKCRADVLKGKSVVLTGIFPEVGGGTGLNEGKAGAAELVEAFGGTVQVAVSSLTDILVFGSGPGKTKLQAALKNKDRIVSILTLVDLTAVLEGS